MNTKHISFAALAIVAVLAGCTKNPIEIYSDSNRLADLELTSVNSVQIKAAIDGTIFPTDGEIGLFLFEDENATESYGEGGYTNVKYSYNSTKGKWTASPSIKVGSTPGYLYGYYPYNSASTDVKAIPVVSSLNGDDVMYASKQAEPITDATAANTAITMNHALARVSIAIVNKGYTGDAKLTKIKFSGAEIAPTGTLNAINGNITATKADVTLDVPAACQDITATGTTYDCLLVPSDKVSGRQAVSLTLTIDGADKTANLSGNNGVIIAQNTKSNITITISNSGISVQTVSVEDWNVVEIGEHKVTVKPAEEVTAHDILTDIYVDGNSVIVNAWSKSGQHLKCTMDDSGEFCTSQSKTSNLVYTFTISDITENTTATIGYANPVSIAVSPFNVRCKVAIKGGDLYEGEPVRLVPEASYSYGISSWKDQDDNLLSDGYDYTVRLPEDVQITACFEKNLILGGEFSVKDDKGNVKKVRFTRGNLYFDRSISIEQHQYDFNAGEWEDDGYISHFMWCKTLKESVKQQYAETGTSASDTFFTNQSSFTVDGFSEAGTCFALSKDEWTYLINTREASTVNSTTNARYFKGCINKEDGGSINGLFIFPDTFTWPSSVKTQPTGINDASAGYSNTYTYNDFKRLQDAGIVFLPAAGYRRGSTGDTSIRFAGSIGCYWSASSFGNGDAYGLHFNIGIVSPGGDIRGQANSVRLVTDVK